MDAAFLQERITKTKALIVVIEDALLALGPNSGLMSYTIDTGQSRQVVTRFDIARLNNMLDGLYNRCATMEARLNGSGVFTGRPSC